MWSKQVEYEGYGAYQRIIYVVEAVNAKKLMIVCDSSFDRFPIKQAIEKISVPVVYFRGFSSNPDYTDVFKGISLFAEEKCDFIVSVGGGSAIDVAKCIVNHVEDGGRLRLLDDALCKHLAIPTTAGTGSEATCFAVIYRNGEKMSIEHSNILPDYVILDPQFLETLPLYQKRSTLADALCQAIESMWAKNANAESRKYAKEAISIILENVEAYLSGHTDSMRLMLKAANLSGKAINISKTTAPHAMSYKLSSMFGIAHGHAVAICLPYVWENLLEESNTFVSPQKEYYSNVFDELMHIVKSTSYENTVNVIAGLFNEFEFYHEFEYNEDTIQELVVSVNTQRLENHPIKISPQLLHEMYRKVLSNHIFEKNTGG